VCDCSCIYPAARIKRRKIPKDAAGLPFWQSPYSISKRVSVAITKLPQRILCEYLLRISNIFAINFLLVKASLSLFGIFATDLKSSNARWGAKQKHLSQPSRVLFAEGLIPIDRTNSSFV
jgi:hypothetical protein